MTAPMIPASVSARPQPTRLSLLARGIAYRRGIAAMILALSALAVASAAVAPSYRSAASVSSLRNRMTAAPPETSGVQFVGSSWPGDSPDVTLARLLPRLPLASSVITQMAEGRQSSTSATQAVIPAPAGVTVNRTSALDQRYDPQYASLTWRQDQCAHLHFVSGHCPTATGDVALAAPAASVMGAVVGSPLTMTGLDESTVPVLDVLGGIVRTPGNPQPNFAAHQRVVGIFTVSDPGSAYWFGQNIGLSPIDATGGQQNTVTVVAPRSTLVALPPPFRVTVTADETLEWSRANLGQATALGHRIATLPHPHSITVLSGVPQLLRAEAADRSDLGRLVVFADIQLIVLIGLATIAIVATSIARRRSELVAAALRGRRPLRTALELATEPGLLLVLGTVPGLVLTPLLVSLAARIWLRPHTPVGLPALSVAAGAVTIAVVLVAATILGFAAAARPASEQLAEDNRSAGGRAGAWIEVVAVTLALVGLVELVLGRRSDHSTPWSLLAPSLSALAVGLVVGRLAVWLLRPVVSRTVGSKRLASYLAIRALRRDRAAWRITAVVAMALALLSFAVSVNRGAATDRVDRAGLVVGAHQVDAVTLTGGGDLQQAVARADPRGGWAMAVQLIQPFGSYGLRTLAIDSPRLPAVAGWTRPIGGFTVAQIPAALRAPRAQAVTGIPALSVGDSVGSVSTLSGEQTAAVRVLPARVLPRLLGDGSLVDLDTLASVSAKATASTIGNTVIDDQVWLGAKAPSDATAVLARAGLHVDSVQTRESVTRVLNGAAQPAGLDGYLAVGILAALLALALLVGTTAADAASARVDELALVTAGVARRAVLGSRMLAAATRIVVAVVVGIGCGLGAAHLTGSLIPLTAANAVPAAALGIPTLPAIIAALVTVVPALALMALVVFRRRGQDSATARTVFT